MKVAAQSVGSRACRENPGHVPGSPESSAERYWYMCVRNRTSGTAIRKEEENRVLGSQRARNDTWSHRQDWKTSKFTDIGEWTQKGLASVAENNYPGSNAALVLISLKSKPQKHQTDFK